MISFARKKNMLEGAGAKLPPRLIRRDLIAKIIPWMPREEIIVLTGARQTGKSVVLYQLIYEYLLPKTQNIHYFNLDIPGHRDIFKDPEALAGTVLKTKGRAYVFIDEVQRLKEPGLFLKGLYDMHLPLKMIVSGSSSLEIKSTVQEALTGRKAVFRLDTFNLRELSQAIFSHKGPAEVLGCEQDFDKVLEHYLTFGGYPAVALAKNKEIKLRLLEEIFRSYIEKDIKSFLQVENEDAFRRLVKVLASQIGNLVNKHELSQTLGIHKHTLDNYLFYLEETFVADFLRPFFRNFRKELLKSQKVYFRDLGLRNFAIGNFNQLDFRPDKGELFENMAYLCLKETQAPLEQLFFWRTKAGAEVDFIIMKGLKSLPFEAKAVSLKQVKISKSLRSFLDAYHPEKAYCLNMSLKSRRRLKGTDISFITPLDLLKLKRS